jgi:ABC-2 type transport system permease protein
MPLAGYSACMSVTPAYDPGEVAAAPPFHFWVLARYRAVQLRNALDQHLREAPLRTFVVLVLLVTIWVALYWVLREVLRQIGRYELIALVAKQQIFVHLFLVLAVMLAFSNAILAFGSLFGRDEPGHLLGLPTPARHAVALKWLEGLVLSSWSFILLGVPLMLAVAWNSDVRWYYYPLFVGHFLGFVVIPSTLGVLVAWAVAMWAPRRPLTVALWCGGLLVGVAGIWLWNVLRHASASEEWLRAFYRQLSLVQQPLLPSTWTAKGIFGAMEQRPLLSLEYLGAVLADGLFLSWLTVNLVGRTWTDAFSRAQQGRAGSPIREGWVTSAVCFALFPYLPAQLKTMMLKDLRSFARDPTQWTQMVIMMGLLVIYSLNLKRLPADMGSPGTRAIVAFLNLTTVGLILATFTGRFIFPMLSLETQQLWLVGLLPTRRLNVLLVKFAFSLTVTGLSALLVMGLAIQALELPSEWARLQLVVCLAICIGLSGLSVGLGARFPVRGQRNPARIASGFGGTLNLIASMLFVAIEVLGVAYAGLLRFSGHWQELEETHVSAAMLPGLLLCGIVVAVISLWAGARHFERLEY